MANDDRDNEWAGLGYEDAPRLRGLWHQVQDGGLPRPIEVRNAKDYRLVVGR